MSKKNTNEDFVSDNNVGTDNKIEFDISNTDFEVSVEAKSFNKKKWDTKSCKVISRIGRDKAVIDFSGFGLVIALKNKDVKTVDVRYCGKIGTSNFTYEVK